MSHQQFDPPLFIVEVYSQPLRDCGQFPFLYNAGGRGVQLMESEGKLISMAPDDPDLDRGTTYRNIEDRPKTIYTADGSYDITEFRFGVDQVNYQALPATRTNAQAFGMTLLEAGECVRFEYPGLIMAQFIYGKWAGHQSPYIGAHRRRELLPTNPTDLEYHAFPHVFFSEDSLPLVISVARWRPHIREISLADLWIAPGDALVLPPKTKPGLLAPGASKADARRCIVDLHGNRNSAFACWFNDRPSLSTTTILGNGDVMKGQETKPHYHQEEAPSRHTQVFR